MKSLRKSVRRALVVAVQAASLGCSAHPAASSSSGSGTASASGASSGSSSAPSESGSGSTSSGTSGSTGTTGAAGASGTSGSTGTLNFCDTCLAEGQECNVYKTACVAQCSVCTCDVVPAIVGALDGGYPDGGLPVPLCRAACANPYGPDAGGWTVWSCGVLDGGCPPPAMGQACVVCVAEDCYGGGRAPEGLELPPLPACPTLGDYLARMAHLEAASVIAFQRLARELAAHHAPMPLVRRVARAARDEIRHARRLGRLARARGARCYPVEVSPLRRRSLQELALENLREGCVRETLGAATLMLQSEQAADLELRAAFASLARDEARHATLAWDIAAWANSRLTDEAVALGRRQLTDAVRSLRMIPHTEPEWGITAGLPSAVQQRRLVESLAAHLWA